MLAMKYIDGCREECLVESFHARRACSDAPSSLDSGLQESRKLRINRSNCLPAIVSAVFAMAQGEAAVAWM